MEDNKKMCENRTFESIEEALGVFDDMRDKSLALGHAMSVVYYDALTGAPARSAEGRGRTMGALSAMSYEITTARQVLDAVQYLLERREELEPQRRRELEFWNRQNDFIKCIPKDEYARYATLVNDADAVWHKAKQQSDFSLFQPYLEQIVECNRKFAGYYKPSAPAYDVLLDQYEPGLTMERLEGFFAKLRERIVPLIERITKARRIEDGFLYRNYPAAVQREYSDYLMRIMGIDRERCSIAETEHPFTDGTNKNDVRITTHYYEDNLASSMYSVIHEGGHAIYEMGVDDKYQYTFLSGGVSMGIHESQSRFFENIIGRSEEFIALIFPKLKELFPEQLSDVDAHGFYLAVNKATPSLIRTEADELTYPLHIMVRYELEKALIAGELAVRDLPAAWNEKYREYLGVEVPDDKNGVLQDSHWSGGMIGYFPSYALGSAYGAQMLSCMRGDLDVEGAVRSGDLEAVKEWLGERIYRHGCMYEPLTLLEMCCKQPFDPEYYVSYLKEKYTKIYDLD